MELEITFLSFNLPPKNESCINYLKIVDGNEDKVFYGGDDGPTLLSKYTFLGPVIRVVFRTGRNKKQNYGFQLKYFTNEYLNVSIPFNKSDREANLIAKGM